MKIALKKELTGSILDIGGGGEGIIGRLYGSRVTAIDNRQEELDEAPDTCTKLCMDATTLAFADESFDAVTAFYSLLFMTAGEQERAIAEGIRVLRPGGRLCLWDCAVESAYPNPFVTELDVDLEGELLHTSYGICKLDAQSRESILSFCLAKGLTLLTSRQEGIHFYLELQK